MNADETRAIAQNLMRGAPRSVANVTLPLVTPFTECVEKYLPTLMRDGKCLVMCGGTGSGKTFAAYYALAYAAASGYQQGMLKVSRELATWAIHYREDFEYLVHENRLLVIDDVGAEHKSASGWAESVFEDLISYRELHRLPTIITTNLAKDDFGKAFGERVLSRITGWGWYMQVSSAPDLRKPPLEVSSE